MSQDRSFSGLTYYKLLDLTPAASSEDIRQAYRQKSKLYHPDTTELPAAIATERFRQLNLAYATLNSPERRQLYDLRLGLAAVPPASDRLPSTPRRSARPSASAYLDAKERPLSPGELFALFLMGLAFVGCLVLAVVVGIARGEMLLQDAQLPTYLQPLTALLPHGPETASPAAAHPPSPQQTDTARENISPPTPTSLPAKPPRPLEQLLGPAVSHAETAPSLSVQAAPVPLPTTPPMDQPLPSRVQPMDQPPQAVSPSLTSDPAPKMSDPAPNTTP